eukprot:3312103-Prymnesium_polylepis.1
MRPFGDVRWLIRQPRWRTRLPKSLTMQLRLSAFERPQTPSLAALDSTQPLPQPSPKRATLVRSNASARQAG